MDSNLIEAERTRVSDAVPVTILTGFLGSGKTTLLNRILNGDHGLRVAVLVNDFGSINIDADLVVGIENNGDVISLANGCVCCNIRDDLLAAVQQVLQRPERPEYIVLEASGVAEPSGIALTFMDEDLRDRIRLDSIMCVMDAEQVFAVPEMMELKLRQIAFADMLILNKADLVSQDEIARIKAWLDDRFHRYRLVEAIRGDVPLDILLSVGRFDSVRCEKVDPSHHNCADPNCTHQDHTKVFSTWSYQSDQPMSVEKLRAIASKLPANIYRCKGVIYTEDSIGCRAVLQVVGKRVDISFQGEWGRAEALTQIVAIGAHDTIDSSALKKAFEAAIVPLKTPA